MVLSPDWKCVLCWKELPLHSDRNLIDGKGSFKALAELNDLHFIVKLDSYKYICKRCMNNLKKREGYRKKFAEHNEQLFRDFKEICSKEGISVKTRRSFSDSDEPPTKRIPTDTAAVAVKSVGSQTSLDRVSHKSCPIEASDLEAGSDETNVFARVEWKSSTSERLLPPCLKSLGKMLVRGSFKQISNATWRCINLRHFILKEVLKCLHAECASITSRKNPSMLRKIKKDDLMDFSFEKMNDELSLRAPLLHGILKTACLSRTPTKQQNLINKSWIPPVCMAASVCMKARSPHATMLQLLISLILQHCSLTIRITNISRFCV